MPDKTVGSTDHLLFRIITHPSEDVIAKADDSSIVRGGKEELMEPKWALIQSRYWLFQSRPPMVRWLTYRDDVERIKVLRVYFFTKTLQKWRDYQSFTQLL